jgi:hypothetical protein
MKTVSEEYKKVNEFIELVLINNIGQLITTGNHYLGFGNQTQAIELIGAIIEDESLERLQANNPKSEFDTKRKSRRRFHNALKLFSNPDYIKYCPEDKTDPTYVEEHDLYDNFRCGYAHQMRPIGRVSGTTEQEANEDGTAHLKIDSRTGRLIIVSEILYRDLKEVCENVITMINNNQIKHTKAYGNFLNLKHYI